jgi:hypothetical protein
MKGLMSAVGYETATVGSCAKTEVPIFAGSKEYLVAQSSRFSGRHISSLAQRWNTDKSIVSLSAEVTPAFAQTRAFRVQIFDPLDELWGNLMLP